MVSAPALKVPSWTMAHAAQIAAKATTSTSGMACAVSVDGTVQVVTHGTVVMFA